MTDLTKLDSANDSSGSVATPFNRKLRDMGNSTHAEVVMASTRIGTVTATIANGGVVSGAVDLGNDRLAGIQMPAAWTAASIYFDVSADGVTYGPMYDAFSVEYVVTSAAASRYIQLPLADFIGIQYLKVRSGTGAGTAQGAARALTLVAVA